MECHDLTSILIDYLVCPSVCRSICVLSFCLSICVFSVCPSICVLSVCLTVCPFVWFFAFLFVRLFYLSVRPSVLLSACLLIFLFTQLNGKVNLANLNIVCTLYIYFSYSKIVWNHPISSDFFSRFKFFLGYLMLDHWYRA